MNVSESQTVNPPGRTTADQSASPVGSDAPLRMTDVAPGQHVVITGFGDLRGESLRIREMGLFEGRSVRVVQCSDPLICQMDQTRVGLARRIACEIYVQQCSACPLRG